MRIPGFTIGLCLPLIAGEALAQSECETSDDCAAGMVCDVVGSSGCAAAPTCKPGEDCPAIPPCEPETLLGCVPAPCESDGDCGPDMVCHTETWEACGGSAGVSCDEAGNCETVVVEDEACTSGSESRCVHRWQLPCEADADCGEGFECEQRELGCDCGSSDGAGVDPAFPPDAPPGAGAPAEDPDGEAADADRAEEPADFVAPDACDCGEPETIGICEAKAIECSTDEDCPASWTCTAPPTTCSGTGEGPVEAPVPDDDDAASDGDAIDGGVAKDFAAEAPPAGEPDLPAPDEPVDCVPVEAPMLCVPPGGGWGTDASGGLGSDPREDAAGAPGSDDGESSQSPSGPQQDDGASKDDDAPQAPEPGKDGNSSDDEADEEDSSGKGVSSDGDDGGCNVKAPRSGTPSALWLAGLLGLALLRRRN